MAKLLAQLWLVERASTSLDCFLVCSLDCFLVCGRQLQQAAISLL